MLDILSLKDSPKKPQTEPLKTPEKLKVESFNKPTVPGTKTTTKVEEDEDLEFLESLLEPEKKTPSISSTKAPDPNSLGDEEWLDDFLAA